MSKVLSHTTNLIWKDTTTKQKVGVLSVTGLVALCALIALSHFHLLGQGAANFVNKSVPHFFVSTFHEAKVHAWVTIATTGTTIALIPIVLRAKAAIDTRKEEKLMRGSQVGLITEDEGVTINDWTWLND